MIFTGKAFKSCTSALLAAILLISHAGLSSYAAEWSMQSPGVYQMLDGTSLSGVYARGIDISHYQGAIDWQSVASDDVDFVMLGTRYKGEVDPNFSYNASEAVKAGIPIGVYIYSYAMTVEEAENEADFVLKLIKDYPISYPVAFDVEDTPTQGTLPKEKLTAIINAFTSRISEAGYKPILYANDYWIANKLESSVIKANDIWVARYNVKHVYPNPVMWQATSTGRISGINGNVDIDFQYKPFSIPADSWKTILGKTYYFKDYVLQKSAWINDGKNDYYMDSEGQIYKGWLKQNNNSYYLDEETGAMVRGWKAFDGSWMYLSDAGTPSKGWVNDSGTWYFLDNKGIMQKGWLEDGGRRYFLSDSGAMKTGWREYNGSWYYLDSSGAMTYGWQNIGDKWYYLDKKGVMQTGVINLNNTLYYLESDGHMLSSGRVEYNSKQYNIDASGAMHEYVPETAPPEETAATPGAASETVTPVQGAPASEGTQESTAASDSAAPVASGPGEVLSKGNTPSLNPNTNIVASP